jgi:phosphoribosylpyrophosphate synthetase
LPKELPSLVGYEVGAIARPSKLVGGDYYDFIALPDGKRFERLVVLSVGTLLATAIANTHSDKSVSSLFD